MDTQTGIDDLPKKVPNDLKRKREAISRMAKTIIDKVRADGREIKRSELIQQLKSLDMELSKLNMEEKWNGMW